MLMVAQTELNTLLSIRASFQFDHNARTVLGSLFFIATQVTMSYY